MGSVTVREVERVGQVFDIHLHTQIFRHIEKGRSINARISGKDSVVAVVDKALILMCKAEAKAETVRYFDLIPD